MVKKNHKLDHESSINHELTIVVQDIIKNMDKSHFQKEEFDFMSSLEILNKISIEWSPDLSKKPVDTDA